MQNNPVLFRENGKEIKFDKQKIVNNDGNPYEFIHITMSGELDNFKNYMIQHPAIINIKEPDFGNVALHIACSKGFISMVSLLLRSGADCNIQDIYGNAAIHYATDKRRKVIVELLLKFGANINLSDHRGITALHLACSNDDIETVRVLLLNNADPLKSDISSIKPIDKTSLPQIKSLIERKISSLQGGDAEQAAKAVSMMSFGIGLGVGLGLAIAKQQNAMFEQKLLDMAAQQRSKYNRSQPNTAATPTIALGGRASSSPSAISFSRGNLFTRENSISEEGESYNNNHSSHTMSNVGAMVIQQKPQSALSDNSHRRFL